MYPLGNSKQEHYPDWDRGLQLCAYWPRSNGSVVRDGRDADQFDRHLHSASDIQQSKARQQNNRREVLATHSTESQRRAAANAALLLSLQQETARTHIPFQQINQKEIAMRTKITLYGEVAGTIW